MKYALLALVICFCNQFHAQKTDADIRDLFSSIVFITDSIPTTNIVKNKEYEIILKDRASGKLKNLKGFKLGTGFFISKDLDAYLVTAAHVAKDLSLATKLTYQSKKGERREITIDQLLEVNAKEIDWIFHLTADVAVLHIPLKIIETESFKNLDLGFVGHSGIMDTLEGPDRLEEITVFGFPLGLGVSSTSIAPVTKNLRPASDIIFLPRFDNKIINPFFLLDDPSISGFSGGPVMRVFSYKRTGIRPESGVQPNITGLVHGTINDKAGGFAAIVPGIKISETIESAPSFNGTYIYKYLDGSIWSEVIYKNGIPWEVISNFGPDGKPQDKGTLKGGNGERFIYNKYGEKTWVLMYKNGKYVGNAGIMTKSEKEKLNIGKTNNK